MKIGLISDNHGYYHEELLEALKGVDEIWHAGDIGTLASLEPLKDIAPIKGVYGNIDIQETKAEYPLDLRFECEGLNVFITHIGGYPGRYKRRVGDILEVERPDLYICGHSHILKVMKDQKLGILHMNPGAYGHHGFHAIRTILRFEIRDRQIDNLRVVELGRRGIVKKKGSASK